jgi:hypothetical protein
VVVDLSNSLHCLVISYEQTTATSFHIYLIYFPSSISYSGFANEPRRQTAIASIPSYLKSARMDSKLVKSRASVTSPVNEALPGTSLLRYLSIKHYGF